jgi:hypothetical protein
MAESLSDFMSDYMADRMPEDLPERKCINVMVGIIRSEVIARICKDSSKDGMIHLRMCIYI